jgi:hypothetical protein
VRIPVTTPRRFQAVRIDRHLGCGMSELRLHGAAVETVFDLLGHRENDMTYALGWGLARSDALLHGFLERVAGDVPVDPSPAINLQEYGTDDGGFTDIEVLTEHVHVIVEAKRGWAPPSASQLHRYEERLDAMARPSRWIVILTQNGAEEIVRHQIADWTPTDPTRACVLGWSDVVRLAEHASKIGHREARPVIAELTTYLRGVADMRDTHSNLVYIPALAQRPFNDNWKIGPIEIVERLGRYFFPAIGGAYPKEVPNYIGFRYWGKLQSIHHIESSEVVIDLGEHIPGAPSTAGERPHFLTTLGPAIRPDHDVRTGDIYGAAWTRADIDLLLTCSTISEARDLTKKRHGG